MATILWLGIAFIAQGLVIVYPGVLIFWFIMHTRIDRWRKVGRKAYWIGAIGWPITVIPLWWYRERMFSWVIDPGFLFWVGLFAFFLSMRYFRSASFQIPMRTLVGLPELEPQKIKQPLLQSGIYSRTRNPIYLAHWLLIFAAAAMTGYVASWIFFALDSIVLPFMIYTEQNELRMRYGSEYEEYAGRTPPFFPKFT